MGSHYHTYIGPFILISRQKEIINEESTYKTCANEQCDNHKKSELSSFKFCPECASEIESMKVIVPKEDFKHIFDVLGDEDESLCEPGDIYFNDGTLILIPNDNYGVKRREISCGHDEFEIQSYGEEIKPEEELGLFNKFFSKQLSALKEGYGEDRVKVKWGTFGFYW